ENAARAFGYPVLLKAAAGGGGKGMRVVRDASEMQSAFEGAQREARQAFGDDSVHIEKYLERPRHIEIQILADAHGKVLHLGERECSVQRRHQKMIEEAPSPVVDAGLRARMGAAAVAAAAAVGYRNAGTIEFLYENGEFYFLEMNTRIQVEHPVTELAFGVDLVHWQLRIAAGEPLTLEQDALVPVGHAIECRITSEDPAHGFLPSAGRITAVDLPTGPGVRWDGCVTEGFEVSLFYDPLLGKLIVHGDDRASAIARMQRALAELRIVGVETSVGFHERVLREPDFRAGNIDIRYVDEHPDVLQPATDEAALRAAAVAAVLLETERRRRRAVGRIASNAQRSPWASPDFGHR
ncbi:MAG: ATP-grasp domain-containing protein, partial [Candidatus Cloacimonetes bacterium]|nr:ATP-grasp domain-containing protein [Candidatus Cloacimonadota bacterium]